MTEYIASLKAEIEALAARTSTIDAVIAAGATHAELQQQLAALKAREYETRYREEVQEVKHKGYTEDEIRELNGMERLLGTSEKYEVVVGTKLVSYITQEWVPGEWDMVYKDVEKYREEDVVEYRYRPSKENQAEWQRVKDLLAFAVAHQSDYTTREKVQIPYQVHHPEITHQISELQPSISSAWNHYQQAWRSYQTRYGKAQDSNEPVKEKRALEALSAQASFEVTVCEALGFDGPPKEALRQNHSRVRIPFEHWIDNTATAGDLQTLCIAAKVRGHKLEPLSDMLEADLRQQKESGHGGLLHQARGVYKWLTLRGKEAQELERA
ncbi:MAG: hypothetical protein J0L97_09360 [Alphaproteobacteria bacterium]|nr:hypothetical protein [Alphaproteobacteria bacterium]